MSSTLTYGLVRPDDGDLGSVWFPALRNNITQLDAHTHNGSNSAQLTSSSVIGLTADLTSGDWAAVTGKDGLFSQTVSMPANVDYDNYQVIAKSSAGDLLLLTVERVGSSGSTYDIFINDSTADLTVYYVS